MTELDKMKIPLNNTNVQITEKKESLENTLITPALEHEIILPEILKNNIVFDELNPSHREKLGYFAGKGALLYGFQGTGKTSAIKKLAIENDAKIITIDKEMTSTGIKKVFEIAKKRAENKEKIYILIDEIDQFGSKEYAKFSGGTSKITTLMTELSGVKNETNAKNYMYVFATTNHLENVDQRLLRAGRLEEIIEIPLPGREERKTIFETHFKYLTEEKSGISQYLNTLVKKTNGFTPADLRSLLKHIYNEELKGKDINQEKVVETIRTFETSVKKGYEFFKDPEKNLSDILGRTIYKEFMTDILKRGKQGSENILLYGYRGTGKSLFPEALAGELDYNYLYASGSELQEGIVGEGTKKIKRLFNLASISAPSIIHIDEVHGIVDLKNTTSHKTDETTYLLSELARKRPGVYVFATINDPSILNETFLSRFDQKIFFDLPNENEKKQFFEKNLNENLKGAKEIYTTMAKEYSFRDLEKVVKAINLYDKKYGGIPEEKQKILMETYLKNTPAEDKIANDNWNQIKNTVGDSLEIEKLIREVYEK